MRRRERSYLITIPHSIGEVRQFLPSLSFVVLIIWHEKNYTIARSVNLIWLAIIFSTSRIAFYQLTSPLEGSPPP